MDKPFNERGYYIDDNDIIQHCVHQLFGQHVLHNMDIRKNIDVYNILSNAMSHAL